MASAARSSGSGTLTGWKAPLEGGVLLDVAAVFVRRGRAYHLYFAAAERGLEDVRRVERALGAARPDNRVQLVYEYYHVPGALHLAQHVLDAVLEVAAVLRPREQGGEVERDEALVPELRRRVAARHALREALGHGGLAHARLADEDGVILAAAGEYLHAAVYLPLAAHDGVDAPGGREAREVAAVLVEHARLGPARRGLHRRLRLGGLGLIAPPLAAEEGEQGVLERAGVGPRELERAPRGAAGDAQHAEEYVLRAHIAVPELARRRAGELQRAAGRIRQALLGPARGAGARDGHHRAREPGHVQPLGEQHARREALRLRRHAQQQMLRAHVAVAQRGGRVPRRAQRRRGPFRESDAVSHKHCLPCDYSPPAARDGPFYACSGNYNRAFRGLIRAKCAGYGIRAK